MLKSLKLKNFSVFEKADIPWSPGLNVILGENGTGKTQLMKVAYALYYVNAASGWSSTKEEMQRLISDKLVAVLRPESLGRLVSRKQGRNRCELSIRFVGMTGVECTFSTNSKHVKLEKYSDTPARSFPLYFPTREMVSIYPGFAAAYRNRELAFDETYYDLALALDAAVRKRHNATETALMNELERIMDGKVKQEHGRFYLMPSQQGKGKLEMPLVAEGVRKIAMLAYLLANGSLAQRGTLFWDEPETNLNPRLIRGLADALVQLSTQGYQVVLATHSLFLLRELVIQLELQKCTGARFIGLVRNGDTVEVQSSETPDDLEPLVLLDEDLQQSARYLQTA